MKYVKTKSRIISQDWRCNEKKKIRDKIALAERIERLNGTYLLDKKSS